MNRELIELAADLHRLHRPYVVATVVWARSPTSGKQGATALIEADGTIHGWIGGACAEPAVLQEARRVLNDGEPRLMYLGPADELDGHTRNGVATVPIACASEGAMEVFMEPVLPQPHVVVVGRSPGVRTLVGLLKVLRWRASVVDDRGDVAGYDEDVQVATSLTGLAEMAIDDSTAIVVATQGQYDEPALEAALATPASYIGLVASGQRAKTVLGYLRDRGATDTDIGRIRTPAGLDLGRIQHSEIAVAIAAELVALRASGEIAGTASVTEIAHMADDPVCGMSVEVSSAKFLMEHDGSTYYFCSAGCRQAFETDPVEFTTAS